MLALPERLDEFDGATARFVIEIYCVGTILLCIALALDIGILHGLFGLLRHLKLRRAVAIAYVILNVYVSVSWCHRARSWTRLECSWLKTTYTGRKRNRNITCGDWPKLRAARDLKLSPAPRIDTPAPLHNVYAVH